MACAIVFYLNCSIRLHYSSRAITPDHVKYLVDNFKGDKLTGIYVQPSHRIFPDSQYENAGAVITDDLSAADILLGVKRVKTEDDLIADKTYMFFSHVIKGQPQNMELLKVHNYIQRRLYEFLS
jgi:alpha-aminoadipic semialdehyde synthase